MCDSFKMCLRLVNKNAISEKKKKNAIFAALFIIAKINSNDN